MARAWGRILVKLLGKPTCRMGKWLLGLTQAFLQYRTLMPFMQTFAASTVVVLCRLGTIALLFAPVVGWVAFNMAQPFFNQMNRMTEIQQEAAGASAGGRKKRGLAGAVGLGAALSMAAAQQADAATELSQLAASDNRCAQHWGHCCVHLCVLGPCMRFCAVCWGSARPPALCWGHAWSCTLCQGHAWVLHFVPGPCRVPAICAGAMQGSCTLRWGHTGFLHFVLGPYRVPALCPRACVTPEQPQEYSSRVNATM